MFDVCVRSVCGRAGALRRADVLLSAKYKLRFFSGSNVIALNEWSGFGILAIPNHTPRASHLVVANVVLPVGHLRVIFPLPLLRTGKSPVMPIRRAAAAAAAPPSQEKAPSAAAEKG